MEIGKKEQRKKKADFHLNKWWEWIHLSIQQLAKDEYCLISHCARSSFELRLLYHTINKNTNQNVEEFGQNAGLSFKNFFLRINNGEKFQVVIYNYLKRHITLSKTRHCR